jgi:hypothetical protein
MKRISYFLLFFCLYPLAMYAQTAEVGGTVQDPTGAVIPKASVEYRNQDTGVRRQTTTNSDGVYHIVGIDPGKYDATVQASGFKTLTRENIVFQVAGKSQIDFKLEVGQEAQTITVDGSGQQINTTDASVSTVIDQKFVENIPLNGQSFQSLETLMPGTLLVPSKGVGVGGEISVNGQRTESNYFTVDGVSANTGTSGVYSAGGGSGLSGSAPGETALGTTQSLVSIDALQEFRAITSTYSAEYGRTPGGEYSFVTRSGSNQFHGTLDDYLRNDALDANNWFNNHTVPITPKTAEKQNDFGGTFGGPVWIPGLYKGTGKTFFFFSYEGLRLTVPYPAVVTNVPDLTLRQNVPAAIQPALNAFPLPNGAELGNGLATFQKAYSAPSNLNSTSLRLDHSFGTNSHIFARYGYSPSRSFTRYVGNLAETQSTVFDSQPLTLGADNSFGKHAGNEFRINESKLQGDLQMGFTSFGGAVPFQLSTIPGPGGETLPPHFSILFAIYYGGQPSINYTPFPSGQKQWNVKDTFNVQSRKHFIKAGFDYRRIATDVYPYSFNETVMYRSESQLLSNEAQTAYVKTQAALPAEPIYTNLSLFVQDEWKATSRLSASIGLRWELNPPPGDAYGNIPYTLNETSNLATAAVAPKGTPLWNTTHYNFAPRAGLAYQVRQRPGYETVIRVGGGIFYDTGNQLGSQGLSGLGYAAMNVLSNVGFPLSASQTTLPVASIAAPYNAPVYAFSPNLKLPYTMEWSAAIEQSLGKKQTLVLTYLGSGARRLLYDSLNYPGKIGNTNFTCSGALYLTQNQAASSFNSFQAQFKRQMSLGLQALVSYSLAHSIDNDSGNSGTYEGLIRGNSDFDIRNNFQAAISWEIPSGSFKKPSPVKLATEDWGIDSRISARSALPVDVYSGYVVLPGGASEYARANLVSGVPVYEYLVGAPGGRIININAFTAPASGTIGDEPRNFVRELDVWQADLAIRRQFHVINKTYLLFRAEAFNITNHPSFGAVYNNLSSPSQFGYAYNTLNSQLGGLNSLYQMGGPRSLQVSLKYKF